MTLIAILIGVLAFAASFFAFRASVRSVDQLCSEVRVLVVAVNGLEATLLNEVQMARESADAAVAILSEPKETPAPQPDSAPGRMGRIRDIYSALEADSYRMVNGG